MPSSSLVPHDDPTLLFTNAGMNQFKDVFLGKEKRAYKRATTSQKCMRVSGKHNDLDNVGPSLRHHTFFEMLGNFSFGDYFKQRGDSVRLGAADRGVEAAAGSALPDHLQGRGGIPRDDEAYGIWTKFVPADRITELGAGRELLADGRDRPVRPLLGDPLLPRRDVPCDEERAAGRAAASSAAATATSRSGTTCSWSSTARRTASCNPLPAPSIDTGMGLERITAVIQGKFSNYDTDLFTPILDAIGERAGLYLRFHARPIRRTSRCASSPITCAR